MCVCMHMHANAFDALLQNRFFNVEQQRLFYKTQGNIHTYFPYIYGR